METPDINNDGEEAVEWIREDSGAAVALIIRAGYRAGRTRFFTGPEEEQQLGIIVHPAGSVIPAHEHLASPRTIEGCPECLIVRRGSCEMTLYDRGRREAARRVLVTGDIVLLLGGGHGFRMLEDCELIETRAGPFPGDGAKVPF